MRAVLIATGYHPDMNPLITYRPTPLLNIADKPIIFHIIESLARHKIKQYDLVLNYLPERIEEKLGDGKRWGIDITYHLAKDNLYPFTVLAPAAQGWKESEILLGMGDCLPKIPDALFYPLLEDIPLLFFYPTKKWSGWGFLTPSILGDIPKNTSVQDLPEKIPNCKKEKVKTYLSAQTLKELQKSNLQFLTEQAPDHLFPSTARLIEVDTWISRAVSLHPSAAITPPVFIGENCQIKEKTHIGPHAVIENNCIIDSHSTIQNSLICQKSYVGEDLEIKNSIVDRNQLINLSFDTKITINDNFILSEITPPKIKNYPLLILEKILAITFITLLFPIYLILSFFFSIKKQKMLRLPAEAKKSQWQTFDLLTFKIDCHQKLALFFQRLPMLWNIVKGDVHFVGVLPRSPRGVSRLPKDWQKLYLQSKAGLITLADLEHGSCATTDDVYTSEVFYAVHAGVWYDFKLGLRWVINKFKSLFT